MTELVLASESPYRRALLDRFGLQYSARAHQCDERAVPQAKTLEAHALDLAEAKANSLASSHPGAFIIGSDQIAEVRGKVLHKPGTLDNARAQLAELQGGEHRLLTAVALRYPDGQIHSRLDVHRMRMRPLSSAEIDRYLRADRPFDCCGSYKIECLGITLMAQILGNDFSAITGLPLIALADLLRTAGFALP